MLRVLVPTDFSANSKAGIRFAIQWSTQQKIELIFFNAFHVATLPASRDYGKSMEDEEAAILNKLQHFVSSLCKSMDCKPGEYSCVAKRGISPDITIMEYCRQRTDINFICISTHGAGKIDKLFGTNTGNLITKSQVPVIAVPKHYKRKAVKRILYATDFQNYSEESKKVERFARALNARIEVLHLTWPGEVLPDRETLENRSGKNSLYKIDIKINRRDFNKSLFKNLQTLFDKTKPSLIVMFTNQHKSLIDRLIFSSKTEQLSFTTTIPLLSFQKN